ncbi:MAG: hydrogenase iron-sulfur subunit [Candidatus Methanoperedenaceae archaeon]|nr:hydrogenase iron-sulfur subunit [Candidatus Methanoperedenaceae archaeon]
MEPEIVAFCCQWCSYAGADLAGTSRMKYPPNIRIIRLMCTGRLEPSFVTRALELGADGVLVSGCHLGDCHYISGNERAQKRVETLKKLLDTMGIDPARLRLEWVSASEGQKFADVIKDFVNKCKEMGENPLKNEVKLPEKPEATGQFIKKLVNETKAYYCLECGKCAGSCPVSRVNSGFSPVITVGKALRGFYEEIPADKGLWGCLTCNTCSNRCPSGVDYTGFIRGVRAHALMMENNGNCAHGGILSSMMRILSRNSNEQNRNRWVTPDLKTSNSGKLLYFSGCLPYFENLFSDIGVPSIDIARNTIRILNHAGIEPVIMKEERCCGHDLFWSGDMAGFRKLAKLNIEKIEKTGIEKVVFSCPECYRTFKLDYPEYDFEVIHITELLNELIRDGKLGFNKLEEKITYHDPCRLGKHLGIYDAPREVLKSIPGIDLVEMEGNRSGALCCGTSAWMNCSMDSKQIRMKRLMEAKATGTNMLITACPKCLIHFKCAQSEKLPEELKAIEVKDISSLLIKAGAS